VVIRTAVPEDIDAIIAITKDVFGPFAMECLIARKLGKTDSVNWIDIKAQDLRRELIAGCDVCFVAEIGGRIVGYATNYINELASRGTIANLAVLAECQGRGVGRLLIQRSIDRFRELGLKQAKIETLECNQTGQHLYTSVGFQEVVRQIHYIMALD
jgi:ribosomal protein S18 acetylase RimI-like enzyme